MVDQSPSLHRKIGVIGDPLSILIKRGEVEVVVGRRDECSRVMLSLYRA